MKKTTLKLFIVLFIFIDLPLFLMSISQKYMEIKHKNTEQAIMLEKIKNEFQSYVKNYLHNQERTGQDTKAVISKERILKYEDPTFEIINSRLIDVFTIDVNGKIYKIKKSSEFLDGIFILAPIVIEIWDKNDRSKKPIRVINEPPFEYLSEKYIELDYDGAIFKIIPIVEPERYNPPIYIPNFLVLIISIIICYILTKYLNKNYIFPLQNIKKLLTEIKKGNLDIKIFNNKKEKAIYDIYYTLNEVIEELKGKKTLQEFYIQGLAHDLRTPALAQDRALEILNSQFKDNKLISALKNNQETYINFINLIVEAYSFQRINIKKQKIILKEIIENIEIVTKTLLKEKNIAIKYDFNEDFWIYADYTAITRVLLNLISNAIENLDNGKMITVKGFYEKDKTFIIIEDNGQGIEPKFIQYVFEKNSSVHKTGQKAVKGLGLSICKVLMEKQNGKISVESEFGKYTHFILEMQREK